MKSYRNFDKVLSLEECVRLTSNAKRQVMEEAKVGYTGPNKTDHGHRKGGVTWLPRHETELSWLWERIEFYTKKANSESFGFDVSHFESVQFSEYNAPKEGCECQKGDHFEWHQDGDLFGEAKVIKPFDRKLSVCIQLSDPSQYTGGQFVVNPYGTHIPVKEFNQAGDMIIFPSFLWHKVEPITWGTRHSLVTWWEGPRFR